MKILFVHEVSYLKKPVYEIHEFPEHLSVMGHDISFFEFDEGRKFWDPLTSITAESITGKVMPEAKVRLIRPFQLGIPGVDRIFVVLSSIVKLREVLKAGNYDAIVLYAVPTFGVQTIYWAKHLRIPVIFRALDVTHKIRKSIFGYLIKQAEKTVYKKADLLSANNPAMARYCSDLAGRSSGNAVHFPPLDLGHFQLATRDSVLRNSLGIKDSDQVIVYMGSFFYFSGLKEAMKAFAEGVSEGDNTKFLLIGGGEQDYELRRLAESLGLLEKVVFTGVIPYSELPRYLALADVAVSTLESTLVANAAFPNKVLQYLATGLPVVSTKLDGLAAIFSDSTRITWGSTPASVMQIAREKLLELNRDKKEDRMKGFEPLLNEFLPQKTARAFEESLVQLVEGSLSK